ncbi:MAG: YlbF family regulator [Enterococcus sp.]
MDPLKNEPTIQAEVDKLSELLAKNETIRQFKQIEKRVAENNQLNQLIEEIKAAQKEAVQFAHYGKPEAEKQALAKADERTKAFNQHPLVVTYRERLMEANDLLHHLTDKLQYTINEVLEEEEYASKN